MSETELIATWRGYMAGSAAGLYLADAGHPLQLFIGTTDQGAPRVVIRTGARPMKPTLSNVVLVERYEDKGGKWNLSFTLQDRKFDEVFLRLADNVYARSAARPMSRPPWTGLVSSSTSGGGSSSPERPAFCRWRSSGV